MLKQLPTLSRLLQALQHVPYLASKNLYRVSDHFLQMNKQQLEQFCQLLCDAQETLIKCSTCFCWQEKEESCIFCSHKKRKQNLICVVESWHDVLAIEKTQGYAGVYHVLGGVICPLEGIDADDLSIVPLMNRIAAHEGGVEIILATNQTPEGEATAAFIAKKAKQYEQVAVSCLARGLPVGSFIGTTDRVTMYKAISERRPF